MTLCPWRSLEWPSTAFFSSTVLCAAAVYLPVGDPGWRPGLYLLSAGNPSHVTNTEWVFQVLMVHSKIVLCAKWHDNPCQSMNSNHHITCLQSVITHQRKLYSYVDLCSCCCAATVIACFWSVCAASPEVLCYRYNGLIHNTQLVWARSLTSTLCSQFFELGLTSKKFLQEFLKSFKALFPPLSPLFLSLVITGECCIWFAFIPENKRIFFSRRKMQLWLRLCWGELGG